MGLQEEEDNNNTNWEWMNNITKTHQLTKHFLPKPYLTYLSPNI